MSGALLGYAAAVLALTAMGEWMRRAFATRIPTERAGFYVVMGGAILLGVMALLRGAGTGGSIAAVAGMAFAATFLIFNALSGQEAKTPAIAVGGPILDFRAPTDRGETFDLASMRGKPFLLKFFRGHW